MFEKYECKSLKISLALGDLFMLKSDGFSFLLFLIEHFLMQKGLRL